MKSNPINTSEEQIFSRIAHEVVEPVRQYLVRRTDPGMIDDLLSETLVVLWRRRGEIPPTPVPWAIGIARLQLSNAQRSTRRQSQLIQKIITLDPPPIIDTTDAVDDDDVLHAAMEELKPEEAEILRLWAWDELNITEISQVLTTSKNAASIRLHRAKRKLKTHLEKQMASSDLVEEPKGDATQ
ncbi:RNA polymerase sigma factor [Arthrobacter sp. RIT-PI-e]|uniref:RNA polymerase sigma factor n=1 Tax=Arthrobacter sp. RIT-PI-e TaxID=1681197 RepID=UPI000A87225D|nr:sigma-70 family RNA polymerase sigma factor [Arthrobacter sp. RIT-PI-e]